jgi:hypothetical protein
MRTALSVLMAVGLLVVVALPLAGRCTWDGLTLLDRLGLAAEVQQEVPALGLIGLPALLLGVAALLFAERGQPNVAARCVCLAAVGTMVGLWSFAAPLVDRFQTPQDVAQRIRAEESLGQAHRIAQFRLFRPSMVYYTRRPIEHCKTIDAAADFLTSDARSYLITRGKHADQLLAQHPLQIEILERRSRFPEKGEIVLLRRRDRIAVMPDASIRRQASIHTLQ